VRRPFSPGFGEGEGKSSIIFVRALGAEDSAARMRGMMRGGMQGMMNGRGRGASPEASPLVAPPAAPELPLPGAPEGASLAIPPTGQPRILWLEVSTAEFSRSRLFTLAASSLVSLGIAALYLVLVLFWRRNNELRLKAESDRELVQLGEAARTLVHEIKNPLAVIRIQSSTLRRISGSGRELGGSELGKRLDIVDEEVERLSSLSDRIREFLKSGEGEAEQVELAAFLEDFALRYSGEGEATRSRKLAIDGGLPHEAAVRMDPSRLRQCLDNLVGNAFEASPPGAAVALSLAGRGKNWELSVSDRGSGIEPGSEGRLFEPFFTTTEKGSGIGLALARRIAESAGGSLVYRPRPEGGSVFTLALPKA
jgi:two-component system sensor histidine kinase HydH